MGFFFPVIEAVKTATQIKFIDSWRSCLCLKLPFQLQGLTSCRYFRPLCNQGWLVLACIHYCYRISVLAVYPCQVLSIKNDFFFLWFASFSTSFLHVPAWHHRCSPAKGLWLILLPSVPFMWWHWHSCRTQSHKLHSSTRTIRAPCLDCLLFCLSITWCKLDFTNVTEELRQTNPVMSVSPVALAVYYIYSGWVGT